MTCSTLGEVHMNMTRNWSLLPAASLEAGPPHLVFSSFSSLIPLPSLQSSPLCSVLSLYSVCLSHAGVFFFFFPALQQARLLPLKAHDCARSLWLDPTPQGCPFSYKFPQSSLRSRIKCYWWDPILGNLHFSVIFYFSTNLFSLWCSALPLFIHSKSLVPQL